MELFKSERGFILHDVEGGESRKALIRDDDKDMVKRVSFNQITAIVDKMDETIMKSTAVVWATILQ